MFFRNVLLKYLSFLDLSIYKDAQLCKYVCRYLAGIRYSDNFFSSSNHNLQGSYVCMLYYIFCMRGDANNIKVIHVLSKIKVRYLCVECDIV